MAIKDDIQALITKEQKLVNNKVSKFAYDDTAYLTDDANGVAVYNFANHNNIPTSSPDVMKINPTIVTKGFRSSFSTLPRMLVNHFFGRVSYNLNKTVDVIASYLSLIYNAIGQAGGLASLDENGRLPYSQLPLSAVEYKGAWNASTNTPTLTAGVGTFGDEYIVSVAGTQNIGEGSVAYKIGDRVIYNGSVWQRISASTVRTVNGIGANANGNVTITGADLATPTVMGIDLREIGKNWSKEASYTPKTGFSKVCKINNLWFALTNYGLQYYNSAQGYDASWAGIYWSEDGKNWTKATGTSYPTNNQWVENGTRYVEFKKIKYANGLYLAGALHNVAPDEADGRYCMYWSLDGKDWHIAESWTVADGRILEICDFEYGNGMWIVGGYNGSGNYNTFGYSTDGKNWLPLVLQGLTFTPKQFNFGNILYRNNLWVLFVARTEVSGDYNIFWSDDGFHWHVAYGLSTVPFPLVDEVYGDVLFYKDGMWLAGGETYLMTGEGEVGIGLAWSTDGKNWTQGTCDNLSGIEFIHRQTTCITQAKGVYVASIGDITTRPFGFLVYSHDGKAWHRIENLTANFRFVIFAHDTFVAFAGNYGVGIYWSKDGVHWYQANLPSGVHVPFGCACFADGLLVAGTYFTHTQIMNPDEYDEVIPQQGLYSSEGVVSNNVEALLDWFLYIINNRLN